MVSKTPGVGPGEEKQWGRMRSALAVGFLGASLWTDLCMLQCECQATGCRPGLRGLVCTVQAPCRASSLVLSCWTPAPPWEQISVAVPEPPTWSPSSIHRRREGVGAALN